MSRRRLTIWLAAAVIFAALAFVAIGYRNAVAAPIVRRLTLTVPDYPAGAPPVRVVLLSDIHVHGPDMPPQRLVRIVDQINALHPDIDIIAGDFDGNTWIGRQYPRGQAIAPLRRLKARYGVYAVLGNRSNIIGGLVAKAARKPVVWGIHCSSLEPLRPSSRGLVYLGGFLAKWTPDFIINCSKRSFQLHGKLGYAAAKRAVIHNGYDPSTFFPNEAGRAAARKALGLSAKSFAIGSISRWDPLKAIPNLLASVRIAFDRGVRLRCFLIGAGLDRANRPLMEEIQRWRCEDIVVPLGSRSDVPNLARAIDLHVLASRTEAFPNVVAETMLSGTPNAVTDVGDSAAMVGDSGWLVPAASPDRLADAIVEAHAEWQERPKDWERRRKAARKQIADNFSIDRMTHGYEEVWRSVAAASASNSRQ